MSMSQTQRQLFSLSKPLRSTYMGTPILVHHRLKTSSPNTGDRTVVKVLVNSERTGNTRN